MNDRIWFYFGVACVFAVALLFAWLAISAVRAGGRNLCGSRPPRLWPAIGCYLVALLFSVGAGQFAAEAVTFLVLGFPRP